MLFVDRPLLNIKVASPLIQHWIRSAKQEIFIGSGNPKNVLFLVIDDLRPALGSYDYPKVLSPNINQLASMSVQFNNAHVQVKYEF